MSEQLFIYSKDLSYPQDIKVIYDKINIYSNFLLLEKMPFPTNLNELSKVAYLFSHENSIDFPLDIIKQQGVTKIFYIQHTHAFYGIFKPSIDEILKVPEVACFIRNSPHKVYITTIPCNKYGNKCNDVGKVTIHGTSRHYGKTFITAYP